MIQVGEVVRGRLVGPRISDFEAHTPGEALILEKPGVVADSVALEKLLRQRLAGRLAADPGIRFGDTKVYLPSLVEVKALLSASESNRRKWLEERFDCDDFAYVLKGEMSIHAYDTADYRYGLCVGIAWGNFDWVKGYHAINWFIADDNSLQFIEPQGDVIYDATHCVDQVSLLLV